MNGKPVAFISQASLGALQARTKYQVQVMPVQAPPFSATSATVPLYLAPPPASDEATGLLLAGIAMLRDSKKEEHRAWVAEARKALKVVEVMAR